MIWTSLVYLVCGTLLLYFGAEWVVRSGVHIAGRFRVSPLIIGLTIVAFGTSLPELVVSVEAVLTGAPTIAIGNVIGSNVANVGLVLGISSFIFPLTIRLVTIRRDLIIYIIVCAVFVLAILDGIVERWEGAILFTGILWYTWMRVRHPSGKTEEIRETYRSMGVAVTFLILGLVCLYFGGNFFVEGAVTLARILGVAEIAIGMSVVALGTSLPEFATSFVAALRKESALSIGNIIGSNLFNILSVIGLTALIKPLATPPEILNLEVPFMVISGFLIIPMGFLKQPVHRLASLTLVVGYAWFLYLLFT
jgi:cation:H+ antiporter